MEALIIFVKNPVPGRVKTRLAATLGDEKAAEIYRLLLRHTRNITSRLGCHKTVWYADFINESDLWDGYEKYLQEGATLGERMEMAFHTLFRKGFEKVVVIGSDCAEINAGHIGEAFRQLDERDAVLGPAKDGGYYLLGMRELIPGIFENKQWSTETVLKETISDLMASNKTFSLLPELNDVDVLKDWERVRIELGWDVD